MFTQETKGSSEMPEQREIPLAPGEPHLACVLLLDTSGSMSGPPIDSLNRALEDFRNKVSMDEMAKKRIDIAIVEFNDKVNVVQNFTPILQMQPVTLRAYGATAMGEGITTAIDMAKARNRFYNELGTPVFKPWIFMITDGAPTDNIQNAINKIKEEESKGTSGKLKFFALGVSNYNKDILFKFTKRVMELKDTDFSGIFNWMAESMTYISVSQVGAEAPLAMLPENARKADPNRDVSSW